MSEIKEFVELELAPIPPMDVSTMQEHIISDLIPTALRNAGQEDLLSRGEIQVEVEQGFPGADALLTIGLTFLSNIGLEVFKEFILPELRKLYELRRVSGGDVEVDDET